MVSKMSVDESFFEEITAKKKAYWLGFLYADGNIRKDYRQLRISQNIKYLTHLKLFCSHIKYDPKKINKLNNLARLWISRKKICMDLVNHGCIPNKSKIITFPSLNSTDLKLAFLLGYYDGDGKTNSTIITSGSYQFLKQIKEIFNLPYKLRYEKRITYHEKKSRKSISLCYELSLGVELFRKMMENYSYSLPSKRKYY